MAATGRNENIGVVCVSTYVFSALADMLVMSDDAASDSNSGSPKKPSSQPALSSRPSSTRKSHPPFCPQTADEECAELAAACQKSGEEHAAQVFVSRFRYHIKCTCASRRQLRSRQSVRGGIKTNKNIILLAHNPSLSQCWSMTSSRMMSRSAYRCLQLRSACKSSLVRTDAAVRS